MPYLKVKEKNSGNIIIVEKMRDYSKDPVFMKRAKEARAFIKKYGLPKSFEIKK